MAATPMTGGEALVRSLHNEGVRVVFGLPGVQLYGAMAGLRDEPNVRFITTRHEQATTYMADGYARAGGGVGVALVVPGPGLLNALSGLSTAYAASSPVFLIAGQVPKVYLGRDVGVLHEVNDQLEAAAPVTKWRRRVLEVADVPGAVREAMAQVTAGRPRPVLIDVPPDTLEEEAEVALVEPAPAARVAAPERDIDRAAEMLLAAERPVIYAGGGVHLSDAHEALAAVAEYLQAGVATSAEGKGAVSDASDLALGAALWPGNPLRRHLDAADVLLAVGTRLAVAALRADLPVIQVDGVDDPRSPPRAGGRVIGDQDLRDVVLGAVEIDDETTVDGAYARHAPRFDATKQRVDLEVGVAGKVHARLEAERLRPSETDVREAHDDWAPRVRRGELERERASFG